jgi:hypothetical protein
VSVLVAMPSHASKSSSSKTNDHRDEKAMPDIVVGVAQLPYRSSSSAEVSTSKFD